MVNRQTYKIVRFFYRSDRRYTVARGLNIREAQAHCSDPETSSSTARNKYARRRTRDRGPWFDAYEKEK